MLRLHTSAIGGWLSPALRDPAHTSATGGRAKPALRDRSQHRFFLDAPSTENSPSTQSIPKGEQLLSVTSRQSY